MKWARLLPAAVLVVVITSCGESTPTATTASPSTEAPSTEAPSTQAPSTEAPSTEAPSTQAPTTEATSRACPEVVAVAFDETAPGVFTVHTTVRSEDVPGEGYADAWEVRTPDGTVLGTRVLTHPHVNEQPFTRSLGDVVIPPEVNAVDVVARDTARGFCGEALRVEVP